MHARKKELTDDEFIDILDDLNPEVKVCGLSMLQGRILYECDNTAFREAKNNYTDSDSHNDYICGVCNSEFRNEEYAENCCKLDHVIKKLETLGYIGIDCSLGVSLVEYGFIYNPSDGHVILCTTPNNTTEVTTLNSILFGTDYVDTDDLLDALNDMPSGFFDWSDWPSHDHGYTKDTLSTTPPHIRSSIIFSIKQYNGRLLGEVDCRLNINDVLSIVSAQLQGSNK